MAEDDGLYARGAALLRERGHEVIGCHEAGAAANRWPCSGVADTCPLDDGVDAAVALRRSQASRVESGVGCAVRQRIPLVLAGAGGGAADGVTPYAAAIVEGLGQLAEAVEQVADAPIPALSAAATAGLQGVARQRGVDEDVRAEVVRNRRSLQITVRGPAGLDASTRAALGQAAFTPVRDLLPHGSIDSIDISFAEAGSA